MKAQKSTLRIGSRNLSLDEHVQKGISFLDWAQKWLGQAVSASPEASIAWSVVCLALPLITNPAAAKQARDSGYDQVTSLMEYYVALECELLPESEGGQSGSSSLAQHLRQRIIALYKAILDYQIQCVLRFSSPGFKGYMNDLLHYDDWGSMIETINKLDAEVKALCKTNDSAESAKALDALKDHARGVQSNLRQLTNIMKDLLETNKEQLENQKEHTRLMKQQQTTINHLNELVTSQTTRYSEEEQIKVTRLLACQVPAATSPETTKARIPNLVTGTGQWLLQSTGYRSWLEASSGLLFVTCPPGCGKSVLSKHLVETALPGAGRTTISFFFDQHTVAQALCTVLHQLFTSQRALVRHFLPNYEAYGDSITNRRDVLWSILEAAASSFEPGRVTLVLDALDQCAESDTSRFLSEKFEKESKLHVSVTARGYRYIVDDFETLSSSVLFSIRGEDERTMHIISHEVEHVIRNEIGKLRWPSGSKERLQERMLQVENRTYLWVRLIFDHVRPQRYRSFEPTKRNIESLVSNLPQTFDAVYDRIMSTSADRSRLLTAMSLIIAGQRPLTLREMNAAMHIDASMTTLEEVKGELLDDEQFEDTLRQWCGLFIVIQERSVHLLHESAREYLTREACAGSSNNITIAQAHTTVTELCMRALHFADLLDEDGKPTLTGPDSLPREDLRDMANWPAVNQDDVHLPFVIYASIYWATHLQEARTIPPGTSSHYDDLCDPANPLCRSWLGLYMTHRVQLVFQPSNFTPTSLKAFLGHERQVLADVTADPSLLRSQPFRPEASAEETPLPILYAACLARRRGLVRTLLTEAGADPNVPWGPEAPLVEVINSMDPGMLDLVGLFLEKGAGTRALAHMEGFVSMTPLCAAAKHGMIDVARTIAEHERRMGMESSVLVECWGESALDVCRDDSLRELLAGYASQSVSMEGIGRS